MDLTLVGQHYLFKVKCFIEMKYLILVVFYYMYKRVNEMVSLLEGNRILS